MSIAKIRNLVEGDRAEFDLGIGHEDLGVFVFDLNSGFRTLFLGELQLVEDLVLNLFDALELGAGHSCFLVSIIRILTWETVASTEIPELP